MRIGSGEHGRHHPRAVVLVALLLVVGVVVGLALEPDDGTFVSDGPATAASVLVGANHAKPLPRIPAPSDLLTAVFAAVIVLAALPRSTSTLRPPWRDPEPRSGGWRGRPSALRGPPLAT